MPRRLRTRRTPEHPRVRPLLKGVAIGVGIVLAALLLRYEDSRIDRLEHHVSYIEGFLEQAFNGR